VSESKQGVRDPVRVSEPAMREPVRGQGATKPTRGQGASRPVGQCGAR